MSETILRIGNSKITLGKKYVLDAKPDPSAPTGLKEVTKFPFENNVTVDSIAFDNKARRYDTCFYTESPSVRAILTDDAERKTEVANYVKYIKAPYEKTYNADLEPSEKNEFWDTYRMELFVNKQFDTTDVDDLMQLFHALWSGSVCEKDERNPLLKKDAAFILTSTEGLKNKAKDKSKQKIKGWRIFDSLTTSDRDKLNLVLQWLDQEDQSKVSNEDLSTIYYEVFNGEKGLEFSDSFIKAIDDYETELGQEKMEFFYAIKRLYTKRLIKKTPRGYVEEGSEIWLGNTLQDIAISCLSEAKQQRQIIIDLIDTNPEVRRETPEHLKPKKAK